MDTLRLTSMVVALGAIATAACNPERRQACDKFLAAMKPLDEGSPTAELVDRVREDVASLNLQDQPLRIYADNYRNTLTVLGNTLRLKADPAAPDGTDDVIKMRLKEARTDRDDVRRYCEQ